MLATPIPDENHAGSATIGRGAAGVDYSLTFIGESNSGILKWLEDEDHFDFLDKIRVLDVETLSANGIVIPASDGYGFTRSGDSDTGPFFNTALTRFEFHRDGNINGMINAKVAPDWSFTARGTSSALLVQGNTYVFALESVPTTGMFFNNATGSIETHQMGSLRHSLDITTGKFTNSPGTKHDGHVISKSSEVQTTDAAQTAIGAFSLLDENTYHIEAFVVGVKSDGSERASYQLAATVYRTGGGGATIQGQTVIHSAESDGTWDATFIVASNSVAVGVTGVAATTIEWGIIYKSINMSN